VISSGSTLKAVSFQSTPGLKAEQYGVVKHVGETGAISIHAQPDGRAILGAIHSSSPPIVFQSTPDLKDGRYVVMHWATSES
jgi:hypothetical protein